MIDTNTQLYAVIDHLMAGNKGLLAADESTKSANKRLEALNIPTNEESRRQWRDLLFSTPDLNDFISGVIMYDETIRQSDSKGSGFVQLLAQKQILTGIKVDLGLVELTNFNKETITEGLDGLDARLKEYYAMGARFAKWRSAFAVGSDNTPSEQGIYANGIVFARYASLCQANGIVPIVEPEVLYEGSHNLAQALEITKQVIRSTIDILEAYRVDLGGLILKTSMVLAGSRSDRQSSPEEVAQATIAMLQECVPASVGAVVFLSGGQTPKQATANLNAIALADKQTWPITYSFSRAVQDPAMKAWLGKTENVATAQKIFYHRLACNSAARGGTYQANMEII